jgi:hypothetical protein
MVIAGCSASRQIAGKNSVSGTGNAIETINRALSKNLTNTGFFIQKGKISTNSEGGRITLFFNMKFKKPDTYLISIRSRTGLEAFRIFLNSDTVLINDRLNQTVLIGEPLDFVQIAGIPFELLRVSMGDLFINRPEIRNNEGCINNEIKIDDYFMGLIIKSTVNCNISKTEKVMLTSGTPEEFINISYSKYRINDYNNPGKIIINDFSRKIKISIAVEKFIVPWLGEINFIPGSGYAVKRLK